MAGQLELFDSPLQGNVKGERHIMEFPFFDLSKRARRKRLIFSDQERGVTIEIKAIEGSGIATIYDKLDLGHFLSGSANWEPIQINPLPTRQPSYCRLQNAE